MGRYLRIYLCFVRFSISKAMQWRVDFLFRILMDLVYYAVNIAFFKILYLHAPSIAGWSEPQVMLFVSLYLVVDAVFMTVFSNNLWNLPFDINKGGLDYHLVRPVSTLFFVSLRDVAASSFVNLLMALAILGWALSLNPSSLTLPRLCLLPLLIGAGVTVTYLTTLLFVLPVFWTHSGRGLMIANHIFGQFAERPDRIFKGFFRVFTTVVLPFSLVASFPARLFLEPFDAQVVGHFVVVVCGFGLGISVLWRRGLRAYGSASS